MLFSTEGLMSKKIKVIILSILVLTGFILRIWGTAGIYVRPDDHEQIGHAKIVYNQFFQHYLSYPVFYQYVGGFVLKGINCLFKFFGAVDKGYKKEFTYDEIAIILRTISALYGAISIYITYLIARKIFDERTALLSSFFLTFTFFHILIGHTALLDPQMGFFSLLSFLFISRILKEGKTSDYILAGLFAGFSIASKYNAVFILFPLLLSHILGSGNLKKPWKLINLKIIGSGIFVIIGFLIGNPPVLLSFKSWLASSRLLPIILQPDPWMVEIKCLNLLEWLKYNKFTFALINLNYSIKFALSFLLFVGFLYLILRLNKSFALLLSFPLFYIFVGLGIYNISRPRDHFVLIPFYIIIASKGFDLISQFIKSKIGSRYLSGALVSLLIVLFSFPSFKAVYGIIYIFHERDTLEFSEDWIYENIPPKTWNTYESYTPFIYMPSSVWKYRHIFPYRYHHNFSFILGRWLGEEPFERLRKISRFVYTSSANSNRFQYVERFYRKEVKFYKRVNNEFKILKEFSLEEIEAKNPEIFIFSTKKLHQRESSIIFPEQLSLNQRQRDINFADWGDYGKSNLMKLLSPFERIERLIVSRNSIEKFTVFAYGKEGDTIIINKNLLKIPKSGFAFLELRAKRIIYPSKRNVYLIHIESKSENPVFFKIFFDPIKIGYEFLENCLWEKSIEYFSKKLQEEPENLDALLYLNSGLKEFDEKIQIRIKNYTDSENIERWLKWVEKATNIDVKYLLESKTVFLEMEDIAKNSILISDPIFLNRKGALLKDSCRIELPFIIPQDYILYLTLNSPSEEVESKIEIFSGDRVYKPIQITPLGNKFFRLEIPFQKLNIQEKLTLKVTLKEPFLILDDMKIQPDLRRFLLRKKEKFSKFIGVK